jgi:hypothetical protein
MTPEQLTFRQKLKEARLAGERFRAASMQGLWDGEAVDYWYALADLSAAIDASHKALIRNRIYRGTAAQNNFRQPD